MLLQVGPEKNYTFTKQRMEIIIFNFFQMTVATLGQLLWAINVVQQAISVELVEEIVMQTTNAKLGLSVATTIVESSTGKPV